MIEQHKNFPMVPDDIIMWKYMSVESFLLLIRNQQLHFHRIDDFEDKEEGMMPAIDKEHFPFITESDIERNRKRTYVCSWIKSAHELSLMWQTYGNEGVAIKTTARDIRKALAIDNNHKVLMLDIGYIDYKRESAQIPYTPLNMLHFSTSKRNVFVQENEVRLLFMNYDNQDNAKGINMDIDIKSLISEVWIGSTCSANNMLLVKKELAVAGIMNKLRKSEI